MIGTLACSSHYGKLSVSIDILHDSNLIFEIVHIVLDDTKRIDPEVPPPELPRDNHGIEDSTCRLHFTSIEIAWCAEQIEVVVL
jgi:hypothetical protein